MHTLLYLILFSPLESFPDQKSGSTSIQPKLGWTTKIVSVYLSIYEWGFSLQFDFQYLLGMIQESEKLLNKGKVVMEITSFCFVI